MATVLTTFVTSNNVIVPSQFRSSSPLRCKIQTINLSADLQEQYGTEQLEVTFPFGPRDMQFSNHAAIMDQIQRPSKKPLLEKRNEPLRMVTFNAVIASTAGPSGGKMDLVSGTTPVDATLETIERIAASGATCKFNYGTVQLGYFCVLTKFDFTVKLRDSNGHPVRVDAQFQLTEKPTFSQELTNLPVIPLDPPEVPIPKTPPSTTTATYPMVLSHFGPTALDSYIKQLTDAGDAALGIDPVIRKRAENFWGDLAADASFGLPPAG